MTSASQVSVTTAATVIVPAAQPTVQADSDQPRRHQLRTDTANVYVGGAGVSPTTGYLLTPGHEYSVDVAPTEALFAVASSGTATVYVWGP